ncbi:MAG: hypothetical protein RMJ43_10270 [Chloroherpetonaceae bacterium]|nr:hypothetical protein [Chthonomonadaceae bacterium]MDW8208213.1 hypothetical protein [Chloroherpetonaceae bacterium]
MLFVGVLLCGLLLVMCALPAQAQGKSNMPGNPWPATDALGRELPLASEVGPPRKDRFVGIFYFLWHDNPDIASPYWPGPYDVSRILQKDPDALRKPDSPYWGPIGMFHYWGEPLYGYYHGADPWVLRRHAHLLAEAGVDVLIFDTTNALTYRPIYMRLCEVFRQVRKEGGRTPQITFMVNTQARETAEKIYNELYRPGLYRELWFHWRGKPLMICDPEQATPELRRFFTLRRAHWPFTMVNTPYAWHWEATYPQPYGYTEDPGRPEQVNVSVAQNLRISDGRVTNMSSGEARGRSFHDGRVDRAPDAVLYGYNFQEQWKRALELDPPFVMVTGWNEWIAGRWGEPGGPLVFVDQFDQEHSRDIEPMKGGHGDNYYYQLVANVRRYKGAAPLPRPSGLRTIQIDADFQQWRSVRPEFRSTFGESVPRDHVGIGGPHYTDRTGRNDIVACKVAQDATHIYFYVRTAEPITPHTDPNWMWLLIDTDKDPRNGWEGFDFIVNYTVQSADTTWLERSIGGWQWERVAPVRYRAEGREMHLAIPRAALGLPEGRKHVRIDFKWIDNAQRPGDIMDCYVSGDAAPPGRFRYRYATD